MPTRNQRKPQLLLVGFLLGLFGIGLRGRNIIHWFFFAVAIAMICWRIYGDFLNFKMYLAHISATLFDICCLFQVILCFKRTESFRALLFNSYKLSKKNNLLVRVTDAVVFIIAVSQFTKDMFDSTWKGCYESFNQYYSPLDRNSTLVNVTVVTVCLHRYILLRFSDLLCGMYLLMFDIIHLIKVQHLKKVSTIESSRWRVTVWTASSQVSALHREFEDSSSIILVDRTLFQFFSFLSFFPLFMDNIKKRSSLGIQGLFYDTYGRFHNLFFTVSLLLSISLMQENIEGRCECVCEKMLAAGLYSGKVQESCAFQKILQSTFTRKLTIGRMAEVSRGIIMILSSTFSTFAILLWQVNNNGLGG